MPETRSIVDVHTIFKAHWDVMQHAFRDKELPSEIPEPLTFRDGGMSDSCRSTLAGLAYHISDGQFDYMKQWVDEPETADTSAFLVWLFRDASNGLFGDLIAAKVQL